MKKSDSAEKIAQELLEQLKGRDPAVRRSNGCCKRT